MTLVTYAMFIRGRGLVSVETETWMLPVVEIIVDNQWCYVVDDEAVAS